MNSDQPRGHLVIVGGGEERPGAVLEEFVRLAGGPQAARIVIMTVATKEPDDLEREYREAFGQLGVEHVRGLDVRRRDESDEHHAVSIVEWATGIYFTGGDQKRIVHLLHQTRIEAALHHRYKEGLVIGGTSAGASMMSDTMLDEGDSAECPRAGSVELGRGMGFLEGVIIDQHFAQRGRLGRLLTAVAEQPERLGIGIGEDTAMVVTGGGEFRTIGRGVVTVVDASHLSYNGREGREKDAALTLYGLILHTIAAGDRFDLKGRTPIPAGTRR